MKKFYQLTVLTAALLGAPAAACAAVPVAHAYQMGSTDYKWGFVEFPVNDLAALTIKKATGEYDDQVGAGEYVDGKYYAYTVVYDYYMGNGVEPSGYVIYNPVTWEPEKSLPAPNSGRVVDMTYDYVHNVMYALMEQSRGSSNTLGKTALYIVDLPTGALTPVGDPGDITAQNGYGNTVPEHLVALASDPSDGTLYAMGEYRQLYRLDSTTGAATAVGTRNRVAIYNDFQSMAFAPDGKLYQVQRHPDYEYFMQIDPVTGALTNPVTGEAVTVNSDFTNNAARFPEDPQLTGLYFEGKTYLTAVPEAVSGLTAHPAEGDPNSIVVSWTLPTVNRDGTPAQLTGVKVFRLGEGGKAVELPAGTTAWTDTEVPRGDVYYLVAAVSAAGQGFPATTTAFAGADRLQAVTDLAAVLEGNEVSLTWTAPTATVNNGYSDFDNITYIIKELSGTSEAVIAENVADTHYTVTLQRSGVYSFAVIPVSCGVEGVQAESNEVTLVAVEQLPYETSFEDSDGGTLWTIINTSEGYNSGWSIQKGYSYQQLEGKYAQFKTGGTDTYPASDWFISPAISCPAGKYELSFFANGGSFDTHTYRVFVGGDTTVPADFTREILSVSDAKVYDEEETYNHFVPVKVEFMNDAAADLRIAFQGIGCASYATIRFDNLKLECVEPAGVENVRVEDGAIAVSDHTVTCAGLLSAYDMSGRLVASGRGSITLPGGVYVVKAGAIVEKIVIR